MIEKSRGFTPEELVAPDYCDALRYLWDWYGELNQARQGNGFGMNLLSFTEIAAWSKLTQRTLATWEVFVLKSLDVMCLNVQAKRPT